MTSEDLPLDGIRILDFSTLLPGPLATLILAEAGAEVIKVERPGGGDEMRSYVPKLGPDSANFVLLNRGKSSITANLKDPTARDALLALADDVDIVVEQYRPGAMDRLGVGYDHIRAVNPDIVYCSITGHGQTDPGSSRAGHDLTYLAESGILGNVVDADDQPHLPHTLVADIAAGSYPAVMNILLALWRRDRTGQGAHLDIPITDNLQPLAYAHLATRQATGHWPTPGRDLLTGDSPRYNIYRTADNRHLAAAPLEDKFWQRFAELIGLPPHLHTTTGQEDAVIDAIAERIHARPAQHWLDLFAGEDVCCSLVATFTEAEQALRMPTHSPHRVAGENFDAAALPVPLDPELRSTPASRPSPTQSRPLHPDGSTPHRTSG
jgi:crotonobetainyl-CoA:carnitine CoA-transferase CaiB-like acyl-CoA transferase